VGTALATAGTHGRAVGVDVRDRTAGGRNSALDAVYTVGSRSRDPDPSASMHPLISSVVAVPSAGLAQQSCDWSLTAPVEVVRSHVGVSFSRPYADRNATEFATGWRESSPPDAASTRGTIGS
jgi:hypothetical protein